MFKNDRMMMILTGLVLAIFAGSMVKYGDRIMGFMSGDSSVASQDDSYSVRAGSNQVLDVLSNDTVKGPIVVLSSPSCGTVELAGNNKLTFTSQSDCSGEVEFAYCVDSEGACDPNAVKINVISLNYANANTESTTETPAAQQNETVANPGVENPGLAGAEPVEVVANQNSTAPVPTDQTPEIATFSIEISPPSLSAPSFSELVSPSVAVASIRQPNGGIGGTENLGNAQNMDQNISTQNSSSIGQTVLAGPSEFAAPSLGETSNISLGGGDQVIASNNAAPSGFGVQPASSGDANIAQLERGPEALASIQTAQAAPADPETAPLTANPEVNNFAPVEVVVAQAATPLPDASFSATPIDGGPIALVALNPTATNNQAGESLNVILSEPGLQVFAVPATTPAALAPVSARSNSVSVLERGPVFSIAVLAPRSPATENHSGVFASSGQDRIVGRSAFNVLSSPTNGAALSDFLALPNTSTIPVLRPRTILASIPGTPDISMFRPQSNPIQVAPAQQAPVQTEQVQTAPEQNSACTIVLTATERSGAVIGLELSAPCKADQMVTIDHAGISFSVMTDAQGEAKVQFPAMEQNAEITAVFRDQSRASTEITIRNMDTVVRAGVSWQADIDLDLNAFEFGAASGSDGHINAITPRDMRTSRIKGGGYLVQLGDPSLNSGALAEVYTLPVSRNAQRGTIALSIVIEDAAAVCGQSITAKTVRTRDDLSAGIRNVRYTVPACGTITGQIQLPGAITDIRLAGR